VGPRNGLAALLLATVATFQGCGGEVTFDADGFVEALNAEGVEIELGGALVNDQEGVEVREVSFNRVSGTLVVTASEETGTAEYERCETAVTLLCYRAQNVVLMFEDEIDPAKRTRLESAFRALAGD